MSRRALTFLTLFNGGLLLLLTLTVAAAALFDLDVGNYSITDITLYVLAWAWIFLPPFTVTAAAVANRTVRAKPLGALNWGFGALWLLTVVSLSMMTSLAI